MEVWNRPEAPLILGLAGLFITLNVMTFFAFRLDKKRAIEGQWRVPESTLIAWAFFGGWFGAKLGQKRFRHKTRKEPFRTILNAVPVVWMLAACAVWLELWTYV